MPLVAYYRVSTIEQGSEGLGMAAQREAVARYAQLHGETVAAEYSEVISGASKARPEFDAALKMAQQMGYTLTVARQDRLSRDLHCITGLQKSKVKFLSVDMPNASKVTVQMMGVMAEYERDCSSERTKVALAAAKAQGKRLGAPDPTANVAKHLYTQARTAEQFRAAGLRAEILEMRQSGHTYQSIADDLNRRGITTPNGGQWRNTQVIRASKAPKGLNIPQHYPAAGQPQGGQPQP